MVSSHVRNRMGSAAAAASTLPKSHPVPVPVCKKESKKNHQKQIFLFLTCLPIAAWVWHNHCISIHSGNSDHVTTFVQQTETETKTKEEALVVGLPEKYSTPKCVPHYQAECDGICKTVTDFVRKQRKSVLSNPKSWSWYYEGVLEYYRCSNAKIIVEVGVAWGAQTAYHLKHGLDFIEEYHVVDPFLAGYDPDDPMSQQFEKAAPGVTAEEISRAWYNGMSMDLGKYGMYTEGVNATMNPVPGCHLRMHHTKSVEGATELFGDQSVDAVFIDGLHTYEGVLEDIEAWMTKIRVGGSLIFNDFNARRFGVNKAAWEIASKHNIQIKMIDRTNAVMGGTESCIKGPKPMKLNK